MKRLLLIGCLFAAFACTKELAELSGGSGPNPPRIVGTPTSELALKGEISIKYGQTNEKYKEDSRKSSTAYRKPITYSRASNFGSKNEM